MRLSTAQPLSFTSLCLSDSGSPAATRIICSTRSMPVTSSVTDARLAAGVHLEEEKAFVLSGDEFDGAGAVVADRLGERDRLLAHFLARGLVE